MATQTVLAEKTVGLVEFRKKPAEYFGDKPVAVLSNNKTAGYAIGAEAFEQMVELITALAPQLSGNFRPSSARLEEILSQGERAILSASETDLEDFQEH